ncbi:MAG: glycosyltransferase family 2 protein [Bacteroidales bacterium]
MTASPKIYIALPAINEMELLPSFIYDLQQQTFKNFILYVCVNQPDEWWNNEEKRDICENNQLSIQYLNDIKHIEIKTMDFCSKGKGWKGKQSGVGWARKTLMDVINGVAEANDIIVSMDVDTHFKKDYFESIIHSFSKHKEALAISMPYYHELSTDEAANRAILRYEIYMRYYVINLWRIASPFSFTALGSAIAFPLWAYRKIGGISPMKSGEDFYLLQKFCKTGKILNWNSEKAFPAARFSDRVFFGTGPAMIKGNNGDWSSYPIYHYSLFDSIEKTYQLLPELYSQDIHLPIADFLNEQFKDEKWWLSLRKNFKTRAHFVKACFEKIDGLRTLQYLKITQPLLGFSDEECLIDFLTKFYPEAITLLELKKEIKFDQLSVKQLNTIRDYLMEIETNYQKKSIL